MFDQTDTITRLFQSDGLVVYTQTLLFMIAYGSKTYTNYCKIYKNKVCLSYGSNTLSGSKKIENMMRNIRHDSNNFH